MQQEQANIDKLADHFFRHESGKMVAVLVKIFGTENLELAEDVVQDAMLNAMQTWRVKGIPDNPSGWLFRAAKNKAIDIIRKNKFSTQFDFNDGARGLLKSEYTLATTMDDFWKEDTVQDDLLQMMYACCHDGISPENQITLILKTLCGFSTAETAKAFLTSDDVISKRLYRTKEFFRSEKTRPEMPPAGLLQQKTGAVLKAIYLLFNEGYNSTHDDELIRKDLLAQAMYLCNLLCTNKHCQLPEVYALMALMCFHAARVQSRLTAGGEIVLLSEQDRSTWNPNLISDGNAYMDKAAFGNSISAYHIEAAIAYEHCVAPTFEATNWQRILTCYDWLEQINPSPIVSLNRLIVVYKLSGAFVALETAQTSKYIKDWEKYYLYHSLLGEMYSVLEHPNAAKAAYTKARSLTRSETEMKLIDKKMKQAGL